MEFLDGVKLKPRHSRFERFRRRVRKLLSQSKAATATETIPLFDSHEQQQVKLGKGKSTNSLSRPHRDVVIGEPDVQGRFAGNQISTGKYNFFTFIPRFLFEQFRKYANIFFLFISCLQQIPGVSPTGRYTTVVPLVFILILSALKELVEDIKRHTEDSKVNNSKVLVLKDKQWVTVKWRDLKVGDMIKLTDGSLIPADTLLLSSSEPQAIAYIQTANLDGETNLKIRKGVSLTANALTAAQLADLKGHVEYEAPNRYLYDFIGTIYLGDHPGLPLGPSELLLRGSKLQNTSWVFGLVIYTGEESKLRLNSVKTPLKRSHVEKLTNIQILLLFGTLLLLSILTSVANFLWNSKNEKGTWYFEWDVSSFMLQFLTYVILYNNLIPISLQVTLEFVKFVQAFYINWDEDMYYKEIDCPAVARTSNLNEELGQIKHLFSDKTGTLTRNVMEFKGCTVNGTVYRDDVSNDDSLRLRDLKDRVGEKHEDAKKIQEFMKFLAVCHTVVPERKDNGEYVYQASSPDEAALVSGVQKLGWQFTERTPDTVTIKQNGKDETYDLLNVIDFTSDRKRMSVIVKDRKGVIKLMCKGADSVIFERLKPNQPGVREIESHLQDFAQVGLRTLCLAQRVLTSSEYEEWNTKFHEASCALNNREGLVSEAAELIEQELTLIGATAIEDKLQEGVPDCIASLMKADIKIWVLTGDKQETAINIGYSCRLLTSEMPLVIINATTAEDTKAQIVKVVEEFGPSLKGSNNVGLVIDGHTLKFALKDPLLVDFLKIAISCCAVICCRVSPLQKAELVMVVKKYVGTITLAVGDGANDVGMIQAADVGVGIHGLEGTQAVCAADYAIGQFRFLKKLLLVHGVWNYYRISKLVLYSFYKNICVYVIELWFQVNNAYSGQILFERWSIGFYNVIFTFLPPLALGLLDRYTNKEIPLRYPPMYKISQDSTLFNVRVFWMWMLNSIYHSVALYYLSLLMVSPDATLPSGQTSGYLYLGNCVFTYTVVTVCLKCGLESYTWTWMHFVAIFGSILSWFLYVGVYSEMWPVVRILSANEMAGQDRALFTNPGFWFGLMAIPLIALFRDIIWKIIRRTFFVSIKEKIENFHHLRTSGGFKGLNEGLNVHGSFTSSVNGSPTASASGKVGRQLQSTTSVEGTSATRFGVKKAKAKAINSTTKGMDVAAAKFFRKIFAPAAVYQFNPSDQSMLDLSRSQHGFAFSHEEHPPLRQSQVIRLVDTSRKKPPGV